MLARVTAWLAVLLGLMAFGLALLGLSTEPGETVGQVPGNTGIGVLFNPVFLSVLAFFLAVFHLGLVIVLKLASTSRGAPTFKEARIMRDAEKRSAERERNAQKR